MIVQNTESNILRAIIYISPLRISIGSIGPNERISTIMSFIDHTPAMIASTARQVRPLSEVSLQGLLRRRMDQAVAQKWNLSNHHPRNTERVVVLPPKEVEAQAATTEVPKTKSTAVTSTKETRKPRQHHRTTQRRHGYRFYYDSSQVDTPSCSNKNCLNNYCGRNLKCEQAEFWLTPLQCVPAVVTPERSENMALAA